MDKIVNFEDFKKNDFESVLLNKMIVYPTDTVYGLGCNALKQNLVEKIFLIKRRNINKPVSVIAPNKEWIFENFIVSKDLVNNYLPGPFTLILNKKDKNFLRYISANSIGVRIPDHEFSKLISIVGIPFVTTSANISGDKAVNNVNGLKNDLVNRVDLVINDGSVFGKSSTLIDLRSVLKIVKRD